MVGISVSLSPRTAANMKQRSAEARSEEKRLHEGGNASSEKIPDNIGNPNILGPTDLQQYPPTSKNAS